MKNDLKKNQSAKLILFVLTILAFTPKTIAINYTINFTGKGASTLVEKVIVQNLTRGTTVTILADGVLSLSDEISGIEKITTNNKDIHIYSNQSNATINISFFSRNSGNTQINVYSIDGKRIATFSSNLPIGVNSFQLQLPKGLFAIQVIGNGYSYSEKIINQTCTLVKPGITYIGTEKKSSSSIHKVKNSSVVTMSYSIGDLLLYKGSSGNYTTITTDIPNMSKTQNFDFVECKDASGNYYSVVKIGSQTWMAENIKTSKFRNGDDILNLTNNTDWGMYSIGSWCNYNHDATNGINYGKLYNWYAISDSRNIAPVGWHIATDVEWTMLTTILGGESVSGGKLKQTDLTMWSSPNTLATNETGFTALPGGSRLTSGQFSNIGLYGNWWSLTENGTNYAWYRYMQKGSGSVFRDYYNKNVGFSVRCVKDAELPTLTTTIPTSITYTTALGGGDITSDGGAPITARGVCWSLTSNPTISNNKSVAGNATGTGTFTISITGLNINTTYYVRAYATNSSGTAYGEQLIFNSKPYDNLTATDADGNLYHTITIGNQIWMVENLKTTKYRNGEVIGTTSSINMDLTYATNPKYQWAYNGLESNVALYGRLYTWYAVADSRNLAPEGWHVATDTDWNVLQNYLIANGYNYDKTTIDNKIAKSLSSTTLWNTISTIGSPGCDLTLNNSTGFSMVPGGYRGYDGQYYIINGNCNMWTASEVSSSDAYSRAYGYGQVNLNTYTHRKNYGFYVRCIKNTIPTLSTNLVTSILTTSATCGGNISSNGGDAVTEYGVCWSKTENPIITDYKKSIGSGSGTFSSSITGLDINTTYYLRAYATNSNGTAYGPQVSFKTLLTDPITVTDADGNLYHTVTIGNQTWMVENLKTTKYRNGDIIGTTSSINMDLTYATNPKYQWAYNGLESNVATYGRLYTWHVVADTRNLAPEGWHVASDTDWTILQNYLIANGYNYDNTRIDDKIAKSISSTTLWNTSSTVGSPSCDPSSNNSTGLTMIPGGYRGVDGYFYTIGDNCDVWTSTEYSASNSTMRNIGYYGIKLYLFNNNKNYGFSVRCVKNTTPSLSTNLPTSILTTSATCGGNITSNGGDAVTDYGICWSKTENPTIINFKKSIGSGTGTFTSSITGLDINTIYYLRTYATNSVGTAYGPQVSFKTLATEPITVTDVDGNLYHTVTIGTQTWMVENLKTTKYRNGEVIGTTSSINMDLTYATNPKYQWAYNGNENNVSNYGRLYTWHVVADTRNLAPEGWRIASVEDWTILQNYLIANGYNYDNTTVDNKIAKSLCANTLWNTNSVVGTPSCGLNQNNVSGFSSVASGYRGFDGYYYLMGNACYYWTSSEYSLGNAEIRYMGINNANLMTTNSNKNYGYSVRCIKN